MKTLSSKHKFTMQAQESQSKVYTFVAGYIREKNEAPSLQQISEAVGLSIMSARKYVQRLIDGGKLLTDNSRPAKRNIQLPGKECYEKESKKSSYR